jgi:drug/metabolite transporter (DMT)-like permease
LPKDQCGYHSFLSAALPVLNIVLYIACVLIWGTTWYAITMQLGVVAPEVSLTYRFGGATLILLIYALGTRRSLKISLADHGFAVLLGICMFSLNYALTYYGTQYISSGLVAVLFTVLTFMNLANERLCFGLRADWRILSASFIGLAGVGLIFMPELASLASGSDRLMGMALVVAGTYLASLGNMVAIRNTRRGIRPTIMSVYGMAYGTLFLGLSAVIQGKPFIIEHTTRYLGSLAYLSVMGTAVAFVCYLELIRRIGSGRAAYTSVIIPLVALTVSTFFENYHFTAISSAGVALVLIGNALALTGRIKAH